jgi:hypothetical protein
MLKTPVYFTVTLNTRLDKADRLLPLTVNDEASLKAAIPDGDYTYLVVRDHTGAEIVKVENTCDTLLVTRGEDGTEARNFPRGSCVRFEMVPAVVKDLICNYDCCEDECPCVAAAPAGISLPGFMVGMPWTGSAVFTGDTPMTIGVTGVPTWATVEVGANFVTFTGLPTVTGTHVISVAATNCDGSIAIQTGTLETKVLTP